MPLIEFHALRPVISPDGKNLAYINDIGGMSNIRVQPLGGESPRQITNFQSGRILAFDWSGDSKRFVFSQATESSHVALATGLREQSFPSKQ